MSKFYLTLWAKWALRLTLCSVLLATVFSSVITLFLYVSRGLVELNTEVITALVDISMFWFPIVWSITILLAIFRSMKYIFNQCSAGYKLQLLTCKKEEIPLVGYGDLVKVWRKFFMLLIWIIAAQMILSLTFTYIFSSYESIFEWFDIYTLYLFILIAGYFSLLILSSKCKQVRVVKC